MKYRRDENNLSFSSEKEIQDFHLQLSALLRQTMVHATCRIEDPEQAKVASRRVMQEFPLLLRALNALRAGLPRKQF